MSMTVTIPHGDKKFVMKNPIMPAASTFGNVVEYKDAFNLADLGAVMPASFGVVTGKPNYAHRIHRGDVSFLSIFGANNVSAQTFVEEILPQLPCNDVPVIVDVKAKSIDEMEEAVAYLAAQEGIAGIEINLNCPYGIQGIPKYWQSNEQLAELVSRSKAACNGKFLMAKAPSSEYPFEQVAEVLYKNGLDAYTCFNGLEGCAVDIYTRKFCCGPTGRGASSGHGMKHYALKCTQRCAAATPMPIFGSGGIVSAKDVLEHIMAGAWAVQVGSANFMRPDFMQRLVAELDDLMRELGIKTLDEVRGAATIY